MTFFAEIGLVRRWSINKLDIWPGTWSNDCSVRQSEFHFLLSVMLNWIANSRQFGFHWLMMTVMSTLSLIMTHLLLQNKWMLMELCKAWLIEKLSHSRMLYPELSYLMTIHLYFCHNIFIWIHLIFEKYVHFSSTIIQMRLKRCCQPAHRRDGCKQTPTNIEGHFLVANSNSDNYSQSV